MASVVNIYLENLAKSVLDSKVPGESPTVIVKETFDMYIGKKGICDLENLSLSTDPDSSPAIELKQSGGGNGDYT